MYRGMIHMKVFEARGKRVANNELYFHDFPHIRWNTAGRPNAFQAFFHLTLCCVRMLRGDRL